MSKFANSLTVVKAVPSPTPLLTNALTVQYHHSPTGDAFDTQTVDSIKPFQ